MTFVRILTKFKCKEGVAEYFCPLICLVCFDSEQTNFLLFLMVSSIPFIVRSQCFEISEMFIWCHYNCILKSKTLPKTKICFQKRRSLILKKYLETGAFTFRKSTVETSDQFRRSDAFIVNFEQISHIILVFSLLTLNNQTPTGLSTARLFQIPLLQHCLQVSLTQ